MHDSLFRNLEQLVQLDMDDREEIRSGFFPVHLKKKEMLLSAGEYSDHMRFVHSGCLKVYSLDENAAERILQFGAEGWWVNDLYAYLTEKPATYYIQAISDCTLLQIHRDKLNELFDRIPQLDRFFRIKTQHGYVALQERVIQSMSKNAEERYEEFVSRYRQMEQQIPQYMIASYLGITPEHLSAIRKKISSDSRT